MSKKVPENLYKRIQELADLGISKRRAGKILFEEGLVDSPEIGRSQVRYYTGQKGFQNITNLIEWKNDLPQPEKPDFKIIELHSTKGILCLFDLHLPYHDIRTIEMALERKNEYDTIILQEVFDFYGLSKFDKFNNKSVADEQECFFRFMEWLRSKVPNHKIIFMYGNHDERFKLFIMRKAQEIADLNGMEFSTIFGFSDYNLIETPIRNIYKYRTVYILHGHELNINSGGVNAARSLYLKTKSNCICGHLHRSSEHIERNIKGDIVGCWSVGCACCLTPLYLPVNGWNNGFAIIKPLHQKNFQVENIKVF
jgi:predicted phosphodiesterase